MLSCQSPHPSPNGRTSLRKHYLLAGVGLAALVAAVVVVVGASTGGNGPAAAAPSAAETLPPGHPAVQDKGTTATPQPVTDKSVQKKIGELQKVSAKDPSNVDALLNLGDAYFLGQHYSQAAITLRKALELDPGNTTAIVRLAMVWHAQGDSPRAEAAIKSVLAKSPGDQEAHYSLAIVYFSTNRVDLARTEWSTAAKLDPSSDIGRRSQSFVDLLEGQQTSSPGSGG